MKHRTRKGYKCKQIKNTSTVIIHTFLHKWSGLCLKSQLHVSQWNIHEKTSNWSLTIFLWTQFLANCIDIGTRALQFINELSQIAALGEWQECLDIRKQLLLLCFFTRKLRLHAFLLTQMDWSIPQLRQFIWQLMEPQQDQNSLWPCTPTWATQEKLKMTRDAANLTDPL